MAQLSRAGVESRKRIGGGSGERAEQGAGLVEVGRDPVEPGFRRRGVRVARKLAQCGMGAAGPVGRAAGGRRRMVFQRRGEEGVDVAAGGGVERRPRQPGLAADAGERPAPVGDQIVHGDKGARQAARGALGVQHMPQPEQQAGFQRESVADGERARDLARRAEGYDDARRAFRLRQRVQPERNEPAHARILEREQRRAAEFGLEQGQRLRLKFGGGGAAEPAGRKGAPVVPAAAGGGEQGVVQMHERQGFEIAALVGEIRRQDIVRRGGAGARQHARAGRGAAAVHAQNQNRGAGRCRHFAGFGTGFCRSGQTAVGGCDGAPRQRRRRQPVSDIAVPAHAPIGARLARRGEVLREHRRIVAAILLQDMQTRFGRGYFSFLVAVGWPLSHAAFILGGYLLVNRLAPVGDDPAIFAVTGVLPYILCFYPGRMMPFLYLMNRQLLAMPVIRPIHMIVAGFIIEMIIGSIILLLLVAALAMTGVDVWPLDAPQAAAALAATLYLAIGLGAFNVVGTALLGPFYLTFYIVLMIGMYISSGVFIPVWMIPESTRRYLDFNPIFNLVEWLRSAYYASYDPDLVNKPLVLGVATVFLFLGLAGERFLRNKFFT